MTVAASSAGESAARGPKKTADLGDNYFAPAKLTVKKGTTIVWKWDNTTDVHDVVLRSKPAGVKKFESGPVSGDYSFKRKLTKPAADTDGDGMPDDWETTCGLDPKNSSDAAAPVPAGRSRGDRHRGYSYLEFYLNELADSVVR